MINLLSQIVIRGLNTNDNYEEIRDLVNSTIRKYHPKVPYSYGENFDFRKIFFEKNAGFVAEDAGEIIAFIGIQILENTNNASIHYGFNEVNQTILSTLLEKCEAIATKKRCKKLVIRSYVQFGQIRNKILSLWEQLGFVSDEYVWTSTNLDLRKWDVPKNLDTTNIEPLNNRYLEDIHRILIEDGEESMAALFSKQFLHQSETSRAPDKVILKLKDKDSNDIVAVSYYEVANFSNGDYTGYNALSFGMHFRPIFNVDKNEKRRLLQATLYSMQQLNIQRVVSRITFNNFDMFAAMAAEGFNSITAQVHSVDLTKTVVKEH
jgi:hypothetical protein